MPDFICYDGEGLTRADGTHDYVLLAASDGSYIEDYSIGGLSTERCFEFLLGLGERHKGRVITGFYTSYDVNMMFRDLPESVLSGLWLGGIRTWRAPSGAYKQYRIEYVPNRVLRIRQGCWYIDSDTELARWKTFRSVTCWDSFQFFQMSFVKALRDWQVCDDATITRISSMKDTRGNFADGMQDSIREYCMDECRLLTEMMYRISDTLDSLDIHLTSWYGAGSIAAALFKQHKIKSHIKRDWDDGVHAAIMAAYFGGRVETFAVGIHTAASMNYDVRSAYPAATANLPSLADCVVLKTTSYDAEAKYAIWHVRWRAKTTPIRLTPFPFRYQKRIFWPHSGSGWYHASEVTAALEVFADSAIEIEIIEGYIFEPSTDERPFAWVPALYEERAAYKRVGDAREKILKLGLNSLYGKTAQSIGGKDGQAPPFQCYLWAGMITADCRARLLRAAAMSDSVLAIATDGLFTSAPVEQLELGDGLGDWEATEVEAGLMLIQPGVYATPKLGKGGSGSFAKSRGFSARAIDYDALARAWREKRMAAEIRISETRFIGFGYALAVNRLSDIWRRWITGEKCIHFSGTTSKSFDPTAVLDAELVRLVAPDAPAEISSPYVPRTRSRDDSAEYELQAEILASQPDLEHNEFTWT